MSGARTRGALVVLLSFWPNAGALGPAWALPRERLAGSKASAHPTDLALRSTVHTMTFGAAAFTRSY